jgi:hypothetical protein
MSQKRCGMGEDRLQEYVDRCLGQAERLEVEAHLSACGECADAVGSYSRLYSRLSALPLFSPDPDFDRIVLSAVLPQRHRVLGISPVGWFGAAYFVFTMGLLASALMLAGVPLSAGPSVALRPVGQEALHGFVRVVGGLASTWGFLRDFGGSMGELLGRLVQVPLRVLAATATSPDGRFYLALSVCTALAFFLIARRDSRRGVRHVRI